MRNGFKYGFESFSDRFYFRLKYVARQFKKIIVFLTGFIFKTLSFFEILPLLLRLFTIFFISILCYDITLNLPLYLLKLNSSSFTFSFCSGYIALYERLLLNSSNYFLFIVSNKYNFYLAVFFIITIVKHLNLFLRLKYDWLVSKGLTTCNSFEEYLFVEKSVFNTTKKINPSFNTTFSFTKKFYVFTKYFFLFRNYIKLLVNYIIILSKKFFIHIFGFVYNNTFKFLKIYSSFIAPFTVILWKPIFKKWSYFGVFRTYRSKWLNNK